MSKESDFVDLLNKEMYELKIADLEAKLSESEKALEAKESVNQMYKATLSLKDSDFSDLVRENAQLKQQLAEKEQENERLKEEICKYEITLMDKNSQLTQQLHDLPKKIVEYFYDEIRHRAILEDDYCPDHNIERKYGVRKCLLENIRTTILKKYGDKNE